MANTWTEDGDRFTFDDIVAERKGEEGDFVITSFGQQPDADRAFAAILAARAFGMIALRVTPENQPVIDTLTGDGRIKCVRMVGTDHPQLGVIAIKTGGR